MDTVLTLLDLSAAFDTLDHNSITNLLSTWYGIECIALDWFVSYLSDCKLKVKLMDCLSSPAEVACGFPQGSVLGPLLFTLYTTPLSYVIQGHNVKHYLYADDTRIYLSLSLKNPDISLKILTKCLQDVSSWISSRKLKLYPDKTDFLLIGSKVQRENFPTRLWVGLRLCLSRLWARITEDLGAIEVSYYYYIADESEIYKK